MGSKNRLGEGLSHVTLLGSKNCLQQLRVVLKLEFREVRNRIREVGNSRDAL